MRRPLIRKDDKRTFVMWYLFPLLSVLLTLLGWFLYTLFVEFSDYAAGFIGTLVLYAICNGAVSADKT